jgi:hypothetical protein
MNPISRASFLFLALLPTAFLFAPQADASEPIAVVFSSYGEVIVQSGEIFMISKPALELKDGDRIQTKQGKVTINFEDGAVMKVSPFSHVTISQREEKHELWLFRPKRAVRRITCFIGKLWFKAGVSKRRNYLQTPTAACGVRGTEVEIGYNNLESLLHVISGAVDKIGLWREGDFAEPGEAVTLKDRVYRAFLRAYEETEKAKSVRRKPIDVAKARVAAYRVIKEAADKLRRHPDAIVAGEAEVAANVAAAYIAAAEAEVAVQRLMEAEAPETAIRRAHIIADNAQAQAAFATQAAGAVYEEGVFDPDRLEQAAESTKQAAESAQRLAEEATAIAEEVAPPEEVVPEGEVPLEEALPEEEAFFEEAAPREEAPPLEVPLPDTETTEQEQYQEEASPSQ